MPSWRYAVVFVLLAQTGCGTVKQGSGFSDDAGHLVADASVAGGGGDDASQGPPCGFGCTTTIFESVELNCPAYVTDAQLTGPCAPSVTGYGYGCATDLEQPFTGCKTVYFGAADAGVCHVGLTFADGFTYSADVTFFWQNGPCCPPYLQPTPIPLVVNNPSSTCLDAGPDDSGVVADDGAGG